MRGPPLSRVEGDRSRQKRGTFFRRIFVQFDIDISLTFNDTAGSTLRVEVELAVSLNVSESQIKGPAHLSIPEI